MKWVIAIGSALMLTSCTQSVDEMSYAQLQAYAVSMAEKCQKQGVPDTELEACAMQEMRADQARRMKQRQFGAALSGASQAYGQGLQQSAAASRPINCRSVRAVDGSIQTVCQ